MLSDINDNYLSQAEILLSENKEKFYFTEEGNEIIIEPDSDAPIQDAWNFIERISLDKNQNVLGYFQAHIKRPENYVENVLILNFGKTNYTFAKDFHKFWTNLFEEHKFRKIRFYVVVGNPAEKQYDKLVKKYGGSIIGTFKEEILYGDGTYKDMKIYELYKENYNKVMKNRGFESLRPDETKYKI